jgi:phosphoglycerate dehydrogenase-like enzyme
VTTHGASALETSPGPDGPQAAVRVGVTRDLMGPDGGPKFDVGLNLLATDGRIQWTFLDGDEEEVAPGDVVDLDALLVFGPAVSAHTLEGGDRLALVARIGVGFDAVDLGACSRLGVLVTNTPDGVRMPMAHSTMAYVLALAHRLVIKDRIARGPDWDERWDHVGTGLTGRPIGLVGLGNIGSAVARLAVAFGMRVLAYDPHVDAAQAEAMGAELVPLDAVLSESDFICMLCPLTPETQHLINAERLRLVRPSAFMINVSRGPVVDQEAITDALVEGRLAGAALDVFEEEPLSAEHRLAALPNVILGPHAIGHTDELFRSCGLSACRSVLDLVAGRIPEHVVNTDVLADPGVLRRHRWVALADRHAG